jgi:drug/metabolite transporter (DMT)-like permease
MNQAILFGAASAALYGVANLIARFANKETGVLRTMLWGQAFMAALLSLTVFIKPLPADIPARLWLIQLGSSLTVMAGTACLYHGLAKGRLAVVAPVMACYGAVSAILSFVTGEKLTVGAGAGLALAALGAVLSASPRPDTKGSGGPKQSGWLYATGSALFFGIAYWVQGKYSVPVFGALGTIWIHYLFATVVVAVLALVRRQSIRMTSLKDTGLVLATALLACGGYLALAFGQAAGSIAIATALSAGASAITVVLAWIFTREKVSLAGWIGVACVVAGVATLHLSAGQA